jgi:hypothetical protein
MLTENEIVTGLMTCNGPILARRITEALATIQPEAQAAVLQCLSWIMGHGEPPDFVTQPQRPEAAGRKARGL